MRLVLTVCLVAVVFGAQDRPPSQSRPPIAGVAHLEVQTADLAKARGFYGDLLGYPEIRSASRAQSVVFAVNERQRIVVHGALPPDRDERLVALAFETTSVDDMRTFLEAQGQHVHIVRDERTGGGRQIDVTDPDGHHVRFVQRTDAGPPSAGTTDRRISRRILHAGLTVRDGAAADRFYKDVLGFSEIWRGGRTPDVTSWINMRVPDGTEYLEYMLVDTDRIDRRQLGTMHHLALVVPDMQEAMMLVRSRTAPDDPNHRAAPQIGRNRKWQLNLYDPDGTRVEFMEPWTTRE